MAQSPHLQRRRGNTILEASLMITWLLALLLAVIDFGLPLFMRATFQHAVREGVRYAITYATKSGMGHDDSIKSVVKTNSLGFLKDADLDKVKIRYYDPKGGMAETSYNGPGNLIQVSIEGYVYNWIAPMLRPSTPLTMNVLSCDRMEALPGGSAPPTR